MPDADNEQPISTAAAAQAADNPIRVAVAGGGIAGLTAAQELRDRGFAVTVYEASKGDPSEPHSAFGGKARSWEETPEGTTNRIPAEHGFRFYPGFYRHVIDTMKSIPTPGGRKVADDLDDLPFAVLARDNNQRLTFPLPTRKAAPTLGEKLSAARNFRRGGLSAWESTCLLSALARLATSCERRCKCQLEYQSWLEYLNPRSGKRRSPTFQTLFAVGLTRAFVATKAEEMSARTGGAILLQLLHDMFNLSDRQPADRVLNGPTSDVWIAPWYAHLVSLGVKFEPNRILQRIRLDDSGRVIELGFRPEDEPRPYPAEPGYLVSDFDCCVLAIPCERVKQLLAGNPDFARRANGLPRVFNLKTAWMNGLVFACERDFGLPEAHIICLDSQWALTLVDHAKVWSGVHLARFPNYRSLISVDISDWVSPGSQGVSAAWIQPPREQIAEEVWRQLRAHLDELPPLPCPHHTLDRSVLYAGSPKHMIITEAMQRGRPWFDTEDDIFVLRPEDDTFVLRPKRDSIVIKGSPPRTESSYLLEEEGTSSAQPPEEEETSAPEPPSAETIERTNAEPLLINTPGSWDDRPCVRVAGVSNLFLAGDYVRTTTDFASMEAANESAKRAVNAILDEYGSRGHGHCQTYDKLEQPQVFWFRIPQQLARRADQILFRMRLRAPFRLPILAWALLGLSAWVRERVLCW